MPVAAQTDLGEVLDCGPASPEIPDAPSAAALEALATYDVLDTPQEEAFDRVTRLVRRLFAVPISTVTFLDGHRQWFKSSRGLAVQETPRNIAFCRIPVAENKTLIVADTQADPRFRDNPLVTSGPRLRFYAGAPIHAASGVPIGTLCAMDVAPRAFTAEETMLLGDLARIVESELQLRVLATTDALTSVATRRAFMSEGERAVTLAQRHRYALSCVSFDLDHFKAINDSAGHAGGDAVLAATAAACLKRLRKSDVFGRLGGEEFSILLPHAMTDEAAAVAEGLRSEIAGQAAGLALPPVTASFGVASLGAGVADLAALLAAADKALYDAKARGRNCCVADRPRAQSAELGRTVLKRGAISFNHGTSVIDCTVRRLSDSGARLDVLAPDALPRTFKLAIAADGFSKTCEVVAARDRLVDVTFA